MLRSQKLYNIFKENLDQDDIEFIRHNFVLVKGHLLLIKNIAHRSLANIVSKDVLTKFFDDDFNDNEIVVPLFEMTNKTANMYVSFYGTDVITIGNVSKLLTLSNIYNKSCKMLVQDKIKTYLLGTVESSFWTSSKNCNINMTKVFTDRALFNKCNLFSYNFILNVLKLFIVLCCNIQCLTKGLRQVMFN